MDLGEERYRVLDVLKDVVTEGEVEALGLERQAAVLDQMRLVQFVVLQNRGVDVGPPPARPRL